MRRTDRPSARFLGLLHGQAVIRGDSHALALIETRARERGIMPAVARHSSSYIVRRFSLDWMQAQDRMDDHVPPMPAARRTAQPAEAELPRIRRDQIETATHPILRTLRGASPRAESHGANRHH